MQIIEIETFQGSKLMYCLGLKIGLTKIKIYDTDFRVKGSGAQFLSTLLETEGLWV